MSPHGKAKDFRNLQVWHQSRRLIIELFRITNTLSRNDLIDGIRNTCVAIPTNLSHAFASKTEVKRIHHMQTAIATATNLQRKFLQANRVGLLKQNDYQRLQTEVKEIKDLLSAAALKNSKN